MLQGDISTRTVSCIAMYFVQVTKGGALTLVSLWKSQFDDSEETTDNEWKQENLQVGPLL